MKKEDYCEKLPSIVPKEIKNRIEKIGLDNTSGATELAKQAAETLSYLVDNISVSSFSQLITVIEITASRLVRAQCTMAPVFNLANQTLLAIEDLDDEEEIKETVNFSCQKFVKQLDTSGHTISELATNLIDDGSTIVLHSYSSTVLDALIYAKKAGKKFAIICTESRPMNEGVYLSEKLGKKGVNVTLIVDSAVFSFLPDAEIVFVGADALSSYGLVNKIGTLGLAIAARKFKTDFYALCSSAKILPAGYRVKLNDVKDPQEIISTTIGTVTPINLYYDLTPLRYLNGIITERGIITPTEMKQHIKRLRIHKKTI